jgi:hypothetical protein
LHDFFKTCISRIFKKYEHIPKLNLWNGQTLPRAFYGILGYALIGCSLSDWISTCAIAACLDPCGSLSPFFSNKVSSVDYTPNGHNLQDHLRIMVVGYTRQGAICRNWIDIHECIFGCISSFLQQQTMFVYGKGVDFQSDPPLLS